MSQGPFVFGDRVQLTGPKDRKHSITLTESGAFHSQHGMIPHAEIVGLDEGSVVETPQGEKYLALRPLLSDFVMSMPRGAAIVYPKDAAQIISLADVGPGMHILEAGVGSGALSLHLLRALASTGTLHSIERRAEFAEIAESNVSAFSRGRPENWKLSIGDFQDVVTDEVAPRSVDRVVLDMLAPWECIDAVSDALAPGGLLLCYVATVTQLSRVAEEIRRSENFTLPQSQETMLRTWHVEGLAVRPDHRMVAHTGFLITARRLAPNTELPNVKRRASKTSYDDSDVAAWTPDLVGERVKSDKVLRKKVREARKFAQDLGVDQEAPDSLR